MSLKHHHLHRFIKITLLLVLVILYLILPEFMGERTKNLIFVLFFIALFFLPK